MISAKRKDEVMRSIFDASWGSEDRFFGDEEKLNCYNFWSIEKCVGFGFWVLWLDRNRTWLKLLDRKNLDNWTFIALRMSGKALEEFACVFLGTNTRERMSVSRISRCGCVVVHVWCFWGFWIECKMCFVLRKVLLHCGSFEGFGIEGILGSKIDCIR
jgi:hypothetical protein